MENSKEHGITLYLMRINPACRIVWLYLLQNNIPHHLIDVDLSESTSDLPSALKSCPHLEVPILTHGDVLVFEAPAILDYLAKTFNNNNDYKNYDVTSIDINIKERNDMNNNSNRNKNNNNNSNNLFYLGHANYEDKTTGANSGSSPNPGNSGNSAKYLVPSLVSWANNELHRCVGYQYVYPQFLEKYSLPEASANEILVEAGLRSVSSHMEKLETRYLKTSHYLCGDSATMADLFVASVILQLEWTDFNFDLWPRVRDWLKRVSSTPHWDTVHEFHWKFLAELEGHQNNLD